MPASQPARVADAFARVGHSIPNLFVELSRAALNFAHFNPEINTKWMDRRTHDLAYWVGHLITFVVVAFVIGGLQFYFMEGCGQ